MADSRAHVERRMLTSRAAAVAVHRAWRMAAGVPVSAELAAAHDGARVVA